jgi:hypothetical protein
VLAGIKADAQRYLIGQRELLQLRSDALPDSHHLRSPRLPYSRARTTAAFGSLVAWWWTPSGSGSGGTSLGRLLPR